MPTPVKRRTRPDTGRDTRAYWEKSAAGHRTASTIEVETHRRKFEHRVQARRESAEVALQQQDINRQEANALAQRNRRAAAWRNTDLGLDRSTVSQSVDAGSSNVAAGIVRILVIIVGLSILYLLVRNNNTSGFFGKVSNSLLNLTSGAPLFSANIPTQATNSTPPLTSSGTTNVPTPSSGVPIGFRSS